MIQLKDNNGNPVKCSGCVYWEKDEGEDTGECFKIKKERYDGNVFIELSGDSYFDAFYTHADFSCALFEPKELTPEQKEEINQMIKDQVEFNGKNPLFNQHGTI